MITPSCVLLAHVVRNWHANNVENPMKTPRKRLKTAKTVRARVGRR